MRVALAGFASATRIRVEGPAFPHRGVKFPRYHSYHLLHLTIEVVRMTDYEHFGDYQPSDRSGIGLALTFLFIGLGAGALAALLLAPNSGKQTRRSLRRKYEDAREVFDDFTEQAGDVIERGAEWANTAKEKIEPLAKKIRR
jgi:hypothetical protein